MADEHCEGRLVAVTEGGYDLRALARLLDAVVDVLGAATPPSQRRGRRATVASSARRTSADRRGQGGVGAGLVRYNIRRS